MIATSEDSIEQLEEAPSPYVEGYPLEEDGGHINLAINATEDTGTGIRSIIRWLLDNIDTDQRCKACGGLPYEIVFNRKGKSYKFSLTKVTTNKGKLLAETDYKKLSEYIQKGTPTLVTTVRIAEEKYALDNGIWFLDKKIWKRNSESKIKY